MFSIIWSLKQFGSQVSKHRMMLNILYNHVSQVLSLKYYSMSLNKPTGCGNIQNFIHWLNFFLKMDTKFQRFDFYDKCDLECTSKSPNMPNSIQTDWKLYEITGAKVSTFSHSCDLESRSRSITNIKMYSTLGSIINQVWIKLIPKCSDACQRL